MGMGCRVVGASTVIERAPTVAGSEVNINTYSSVLSTVSIESIGAAVGAFSLIKRDGWRIICWRDGWRIICWRDGWRIICWRDGWCNNCFNLAGWLARWLVHL